MEATTKVRLKKRQFSVQHQRINSDEVFSLLYQPLHPCGDSGSLSHGLEMEACAQLLGSKIPGYPTNTESWLIIMRFQST